MWGCVFQCFHLAPFCWGLLSGDRTQWPCSGKLRLGFLLTEATEYHWDCALKTVVVVATQPLRQGDAKDPGSAGAPRGEKPCWPQRSRAGPVCWAWVLSALLCHPGSWSGGGRILPLSYHIFSDVCLQHLLWLPGHTCDGRAHGHLR